MLKIESTADNRHAGVCSVKALRAAFELMNRHGNVNAAAGKACERSRPGKPGQMRVYLPDSSFSGSYEAVRYRSGALMRPHLSLAAASFHRLGSPEIRRPC